MPLVKDRMLDAGISPHREFLIRYIETKWLNDTVLHYCFMDYPLSWKGGEEGSGAISDLISAGRECVKIMKK